MRVPSVKLSTSKFIIHSVLHAVSWLIDQLISLLLFSWSEVKRFLRSSFCSFLEMKKHNRLARGLAALQFPKFENMLGVTSIL